MSTTEAGGVGASRATLRVLEQKGPLSWTWEFADALGRTRGEVHLDPSSPSDQLLLERNALAKWVDPPALRAEIASHLKQLLGPIAARIEATPASILHVKALRAGYLALSMPFELVFRRGGLPGPVVRIASRTRRMEPSREPTEKAEAIAAAFALRGVDPYLPLHAEAADFASVAGESGTPYREHFMMFSAEDLLEMTRGASMVHLAGHGRNGALACDWRGLGTEGRLTSTHLIEAWEEDPPRLVVLNFCESSGEGDSRRLIELGTVGSTEFQEHEHRLLSPIPDAPSPSMALDLVAALPTAVLALRTTADDAQARTFSRSFYSRHLLDRLSIEDAYAATLAEHEFSDEIGLPVPTLYTSEAMLPRLGAEPPAPSSPTAHLCLETEQRRLVNLFQRATAPLGRNLRGNWFCSFGARDEPALERKAEEAVEAAIGLWDRLDGDPNRPPPERKEIDPHHRILARSLDRSDVHRYAVDLPVESVGHDVSLGELLAFPRSLAFADIALIAYATCDVPPLIDAVLKCDLHEIAERLSRVTSGRSLYADRRLRWDLACELIEALPPARSAEVKGWSDAKWEAVKALGDDAVDVLASHYPHGTYTRRLDETVTVLAKLSQQSGISEEEIHSTLDKLISTGVMLVALSALDESSPRLLFVDMLTASRAWAECSPAAAEAYGEYLIDRQLEALPGDDFLDVAPLAQLTGLAELCLAAGDPRLTLLLEALEKRDDGAVLAEDLRDRAGENVPQSADLLDQQRRSGSWRSWDAAFQSGQPEQATLLLEEIDGRSDADLEHPLRIPVSRLLLMGEDQADEALKLASELERQLLAILMTPGEKDLELSMLLAVRQMKARLELLRDDAEEAARILMQNYLQTRSRAHHPSAYVFAGASAVSFISAGSTQQARAIWEAIEDDVGRLPVSASRVFARSAELMLLSSEKRRLQARVAADALLDDLGSWRDPRPDMTRIAIEWCAMGQLGEAKGFALMSLRKMVEGRFPAALNMDIDRSLLARVFSTLSPEEALATADQLADLLAAPLEALGVAPDDLRERVRSDHRLLAEAPAESLAELNLGKSGMTILANRAAAGCRLAATILLCAAEEEPASGDSAEGPVALMTAVDFERLTRTHGSLREAVKPLLNEEFDTRIPVLAASFHGDSEARAQAIGMMVADLKSDEEVVEAQFAVVAGEGDRAQQILGRGGPLNAVAAVASALEACITSRGSPAPDDSPLARTSADSWRLLLDHCPDRAGIAAAGLRGLTRLLGPDPGPLHSLQAGRPGEETLDARPGLRCPGALVAEILSKVEGEPEIQVALAEAGLKTDAAADALNLLRRLDGRVSGPLKVRLRSAVLEAQIRRADRRGCAAAVDALEEALAEPGQPPTGLGSALGLIATGGLLAGRYEAARRACKALVAGPTRLAEPDRRATVYFNGFQAAMLIDGAHGGAEMLRMAGEDLGFPTACWIVDSSSLATFDGETADPLAEELLALLSTTQGSPPATGDQMQSIMEDVLREIEAAGRWPALQELMRERLKDR